MNKPKIPLSKKKGKAMQIATIEPTTVDINELIKDLMGFEPTDLAVLITPPGESLDAPLFGLQRFMRHVLELAIQLGERPHLALRLKSGTTRNARTENLALLFVWALMKDKRWLKGLPSATLEPAQSDVAEPPIRIDRRIRRMSIDALVADFEKPVATKMSRLDLPKESYPVSASDMIQAELGLETAMLHNGLRGDDAGVEAVFAGRPEARARAGLNFLLLNVLAKFHVMRDRRTTQVRLSDEGSREAEAFEGCSARAANLSTLLAAALHIDEKHEVFFVPPRQRSEDETAMLMQAAKCVYLDYSKETMRGLELICDGIEHFGCLGGNTFAERLLYCVSNECDPDRQRMPPVVAMIAMEVQEANGSAMRHSSRESGATLH